MRFRRSFAPVLAALVVALAACQKAEEAPTPTPDQASFEAASTLFARPPREVPPTPTVTPVSAVELELNRSIARMEQAVLAQDKDGYMAYVSERDPLFWAEHSRWAQDWVDFPLERFDIELYGIRSETPDTASARMTILWSQRGRVYAGSAGGATISAIFYFEDDRWRFGGEDWRTLETDGIRLYYFSDPIVDHSEQANTVAEFLPGIYRTITGALDYTPDAVAPIRIYDNTAAIQTMTRLSIPLISTWNEPDEGIKIALGPNELPPTEPQISRAFTRFVLYEMAGGTHGGFPWWLEEGIAEFGGNLLTTLSHRNRVVQRVAARSLAPEGADERLIAWDSIESRPDWPPDELQVAADQGFSFVQFVTETFGEEARNAWIGAIAANEPLDDACQAHLGAGFVELDERWRAWLVDQL